MYLSTYPPAHPFNHPSLYEVAFLYTSSPFIFVNTYIYIYLYMHIHIHTCIYIYIYNIHITYILPSFCMHLYPGCPE